MCMLCHLIGRYIFGKPNDGTQAQSASLQAGQRVVSLETFDALYDYMWLTDIDWQMTLSSLNSRKLSNEMKGHATHWASFTNILVRIVLDMNR